MSRGSERGRYDKTPSMFSPEGRIFQLEYARIAMRRGLITLSIVAKDSVIIAGLIPKSRLLYPIEKIFQIDDHIAAAYTGYAADGRVLINIAREIAYRNRLVFGEEIDVFTLANTLGDYMQQFTQYGGVRPFGAGLFIGGYDLNGPNAAFVDPGGTIFRVKAYCVGKYDDKVLDLLKTKYSRGISSDDALKLAIEGLHVAMLEEKKVGEKEEKGFETEVSHERIVVVRIDEKGVHRVPEDTIKEILKEIGKGGEKQ